MENKVKETKEYLKGYDDCKKNFNSIKKEAQKELLEELIEGNYNNLDLGSTIIIKHQELLDETNKENKK